MQEIEKSELTQEYMKELYEQKVILRVGLSDVWYSYPSSQCLANMLQWKSSQKSSRIHLKSKQVVNRGGNVTRVVHEQAEKELGRSNISFRNFLANLGKGEKPPQLSFEADSE